MSFRARCDPNHPLPPPCDPALFVPYRDVRPQLFYPPSVSFPPAGPFQRTVVSHSPPFTLPGEEVTRMAGLFQQTMMLSPPPFVPPACVPVASALVVPRANTYPDSRRCVQERLQECEQKGDVWGADATIKGMRLRGMESHTGDVMSLWRTYLRHHELRGVVPTHEAYEEIERCVKETCGTSTAYDEGTGKIFTDCLWDGIRSGDVRGAVFFAGKVREHGRNLRIAAYDTVVRLCAGTGRVKPLKEFLGYLRGDTAVPDASLARAVLRAYGSSGLSDSVEEVYRIFAEVLFPAGLVVDIPLVENIAGFFFGKQGMAGKIMDLLEKEIGEGIVLDYLCCASMMRKAGRSFPAKEAVRLADLLLKQLDREKIRSELEPILCCNMLLAYRRGYEGDPGRIGGRVGRFAVMIRGASLHEDLCVAHLLASMDHRDGGAERTLPAKDPPFDYAEAVAGGADPEILVAMVTYVSRDTPEGDVEEGGRVRCYAVLEACARHRQGDPQANMDQALRFSRHMKRAGITLDARTFEIMKDLCCRAGHREGVESLLAEMKSMPHRTTETVPYRMLAEHPVEPDVLFEMVTGFPDEGGRAPSIELCRERCNAVLDMYDRCDRVTRRQCVVVPDFFQHMEAAGVTPDLHTFAKVIAVHCRIGGKVRAANVVRAVARKGTESDHAYRAYYASVMRGKRMDPGEIICAITSPDPLTSSRIDSERALHQCNLVLDVCVGDTERAVLVRKGQVLEGIVAIARAGLRPDVKTVNAIMEISLAAGEGPMADAYFRYIQSEMVCDTTTSLIRMEWEKVPDAVAKHPEKALGILSSEEGDGAPRDTLFFNRVIHICCRAHDWEKAGTAFRFMVARGCRPDRTTYRTMMNAGMTPEELFALISGSGEHENDARDARTDLCGGVVSACVQRAPLGTREQEWAVQFSLCMREAGVRPDGVVFDLMMCICCQYGRYHAKTREVFDYMVEGGRGCRPDEQTYASMINYGNVEPRVLFDIITSAPSPERDDAESVRRKRCVTALRTSATARHRKPKAWNPEQVLSFSLLMKKSRIMPDPTACEAVVNLCCLSGKGEWIRDLQRRMEGGEERANHYEIYAEAVRHGVEGGVLFEIVTSFLIPADIAFEDFVKICRDRCNAVLCAYAMRVRSDGHKRREEAERFLSYMQQTGIRPDTSTFGLMVRISLSATDPVWGLGFLESMCGESPRLGRAIFTTLSDAGVTPGEIFAFLTGTGEEHDISSDTALRRVCLRELLAGWMISADSTCQGALSSLSKSAADREDVFDEGFYEVFTAEEIEPESIVKVLYSLFGRERGRDHGEGLTQAYIRVGDEARARCSAKSVIEAHRECADKGGRTSFRCSVRDGEAFGTFRGDGEGGGGDDRSRAFVSPGSVPAKSPAEPLVEQDSVGSDTGSIPGRRGESVVGSLQEK
ncbi:MAG: hypothetical protein OXF02_07065 [Simkaniaceae bacterium]|nr:hypothetical protein [Simkaniaceae bacterium]